MALLQVAEAEVRFGGVHALRGADLTVGAGTIILAFYADGVLPLVYDRVHRWWSGLAAPHGAPVRLGQEERSGSLAGSRAA